MQAAHNAFVEVIGVVNTVVVSLMKVANDIHLLGRFDHLSLALKYTYVVHVNCFA